MAASHHTKALGEGLVQLTSVRVYVVFLRPRIQYALRT
jgi:hypothetical protein